MRAIIIAIAAVGLARLSVLVAQDQTAAASGIEGVITVSPIRPGPIHRGDERPNSAPFANMTLVATNAAGARTSFTTDAQGRFRLALPPGHYVVGLENARLTRCGPFDVDVAVGTMSHVEWHCDSGMR